jgi:chaperone required for assembly of F1-ATPase
MKNSTGDPVQIPSEMLAHLIALEWNVSNLQSNKDFNHARPLVS